MKRLSSVRFGDDGRIFNEKGMFRALEIWTRIHAQGVAEVTDNLSKTGTNRSEKKYKVKNLQYRSAIAYLEALEAVISRSFVDDMANDSSNYREIQDFDDSFFQ